MDILVTNKQLRNAFDHMMSKYDDTVLVDYDMSMGSRRDPHIVKLFTTKDDRFFTQSYMGVLDPEKPIDVESSMLDLRYGKKKVLKNIHYLCIRRMYFEMRLLFTRPIRFTI